MKPLIAIVIICGAFGLGWITSRHQVLKEYPPETVRFISETARLTGGMKPAEQRELLETMRQNLSAISRQSDYQALHEGLSARYFQLTLDKEGEAAAKALAVKQIQKFRERYEKGLDFPEDQKELAKVLYESTTPAGE